jgi:hypothetical protein
MSLRFDLLCVENLISLFHAPLGIQSQPKVFLLKTISMQRYPLLGICTWFNESPLLSDLSDERPAVRYQYQQPWYHIRLLCADVRPPKREFRANRAATKPLRHRAHFILARTRNSNILLATWNRRLVRWCLPAFRSNSSQFCMWNSRVRGCQKFASKFVKAQMTFRPVRSAYTYGLLLT